MNGVPTLRVGKALRFLLMAAAVSAALLLLRPIAQAGVGVVVRSSANLLVQDVSFGGQGRVEFVPALASEKPVNRQEPHWDTFMVLRNQSNGVEARRTLSSTRLFYTSSCVYVGLTVALGRQALRRRRLLVFAIGALLLQLTILAGTLVAVLYDFALPGPLHACELGEVTLSLASAVVHTLHHRLGTAYLLPIVVWAFALHLGLAHPRAVGARIS